MRKVYPKQRKYIIIGKYCLEFVKKLICILIQMFEGNGMLKIENINTIGTSNTYKYRKIINWRK